MVDRIPYLILRTFEIHVALGVVYDESAAACTRKVLMVPWPLATASEDSAAATTPTDLRFTLPPVADGADANWQWLR